MVTFFHNQKTWRLRVLTPVNIFLQLLGFQNLQLEKTYFPGHISNQLSNHHPLLQLRNHCRDLLKNAHQYLYEVLLELLVNSKSHDNCLFPLLKNSRVPTFPLRLAFFSFRYFFCGVSLLFTHT